jgi:ERCC4-type nuclease
VLYVNQQEYNTLKEWLPPDTVVDSEIATDAIVQGVEKNRMYERKEIKDFLASIVDGRIWEQLKMLSDNKEAYEPYVILEGTGFYDFAEKRWLSLKQWMDLHPDRKMAFYEALVAFRAFKVGLILTMDKQDTALFLSYENAKLGKAKEKREFPERGGFRRNWDTAKKKEYLLEAFGPKVGKALRKEYGSVRNLIEQNSDFDEGIVKRLADIKLESGRRIGETKGKEIWAVMFT